jgi:hypothetical protein
MFTEFWQLGILTNISRAHYDVIDFRRYSSQGTAVLGKGSSSSDHGVVSRKVTRSSWRLLRFSGRG